MSDSPPTPQERMSVEAVGEAYERYREELRHFMTRRARMMQDADDLVQEVYMQLLRFPPAEALREPQSYLYRIAWHVVNQANRRSQQQAAPYEPMVLERMMGGSLEFRAGDAAERLAAEQQLMRALSQLPRPCQAAIILFKRDGLSYKEIAAELAISEHTVKKHIARAIVHFKRCATEVSP